MNKQNIVIPNVTKPNTGIFFNTEKGQWYVHYKVDGVQKVIKTNCTKKLIAAARVFRDDLYAALRNKGATVAARKPVDNSKRAVKAKEDPMAYIHQRKPFTFVIGGKVLAECDSEDEARAARDKYFKAEGGRG